MKEEREEAVESVKYENGTVMAKRIKLEPLDQPLCSHHVSIKDEADDVDLSLAKVKHEKKEPTVKKKARTINKDVKEVCAICLSNFMSQTTGKPNVCNHKFCLDCIQEWSKNTNSCPIDRKVFTFIVTFNPKDKSSTEIYVEDRVQRNDENFGFPQLEFTFCEICGESNNEDRMLLCDRCDKGWHMDCLNPPLQTVPIEEWFCPQCVPLLQREETVQPSTSRQPRITKKRKVVKRCRRKRRYKRTNKRFKTTITLKSKSSSAYLRKTTQKYARLVKTTKSLTDGDFKSRVKLLSTVKIEGSTTIRRTIKKRRKTRRRRRRTTKRRRRTTRFVPLRKRLTNNDHLLNNVLNMNENSNLNSNEKNTIDSILTNGRLSPILFIDNNDPTPPAAKKEPTESQKIQDTANILNNIMSSQNLLFTNSSKVKIVTNGSLLVMNKEEVKKSLFPPKIANEQIQKVQSQSSAESVDLKKNLKRESSSSSSTRLNLADEIKTEKKKVKIENFFAESNERVKSSSLNFSKSTSIKEKPKTKINTNQSPSNKVREEDEKIITDKLTKVKKEMNPESNSNDEPIRSTSSEEKKRIQEIDKLAKPLVKPLFATGKISKDEYKNLMKKIVKNLYRSTIKDETSLLSNIKKIISTEVAAK